MSVDVSMSLSPVFICCTTSHCEYEYCSPMANVNVAVRGNCNCFTNCIFIFTTTSISNTCLNKVMMMVSSCWSWPMRRWWLTWWSPETVDHRNHHYHQQEHHLIKDESVASYAEECLHMNDGHLIWSVCVLLGCRNWLWPTRCARELSNAITCCSCCFNPVASLTLSTV